MPDVTINSQKSEAEMTQEEKECNVVFGFDEAGFLCIKAHLKLGKWNLWGILMDAHNLILAHFANMNMQKAEHNKRLVRPNGMLEAFKHKWR